MYAKALKRKGGKQSRAHFAVRKNTPRGALIWSYCSRYECYIYVFIVRDCSSFNELAGGKKRSREGVSKRQAARAAIILKSGSGSAVLISNQRSVCSECIIFSLIIMRRLVDSV